MTAERMTALREELARAAGASERLSVLAEMIDLAAEFSQAGGDDAAIAAAALDDVLRELSELRAPVGPPLQPDDHAFALYLAAQACLLRDSGADLDDAIACLRELRDELLAEPSDVAPDPDDAGEPAAGEAANAEDFPDFWEIMVEVEVKLGQALFQRVTRPGGGVAELDGAGAALRAALDWMPSDAPARLAVIMGLAWCYGLRYISYGGTQDHRLAGLALAAEGLVVPGATEDEVASCHVIVAWLALTRQMASEQRTLRRQGELDAARRGDGDSAALIAVLGDVRIDPSDAQTALRHLRQVPDGAEIAEDLAAMAPSLAGLAHLALMKDGQVSEDVGQVAEQLKKVARQPPPGVFDQGEMLALRAAMLSARAEGEAHQSELGSAAEALQDAATRLPKGHPMRGPLADQLGRSLRQQVDRADSAADFAAEIEPVMAMLEQMPPDDPQFARALTFAAVHLLGAMPAHRAAVPFDRILAQLDRVITRLPPDDPVRHLGEVMRWAVIGTKAAIEHQPGQLKTATIELRRHAGQLPADSIVRPLALLGVVSALIERFAMTGELRPLEEAKKDIEGAVKAIEEAAARGAPGESVVLDSMRGQLAYLRGVIDIAHVQHDSPDLDLTRTMADMEQAAELMKRSGQGLRPRLVAELESVRILRELTAPSRGSAMSLGQPERDAFDKILAEVRGMSRDHIDYPALSAQAASGLMMRGIIDRDKTAMGQGIALLAEACSVPNLTFRERPRLLSAHGFALLSRHDLTRDPRDLSLAIDRLEEARRAVEQELGSPYAASVLQTLAYAYRIRGNAARGDVNRAVTIGLDALRERSGDVLLQDNDADALLAARRVTNDAIEMARWFLAHDRASAAIEALEYGRGTVLHAATSGARLAEALEDAGHVKLAAEWVTHVAGSEAADDLRYRIMTALEGSVAEAWLLAPPSLGDITAALRASHADTLVYLLPHGDDGPGLAVLVDVGGNVRPLFLPRLRTDQGSPVGSFLEARRAAEAATRALRITETKVKASQGEQKRAAQEEQRTAQERLRAADGPWRTALGELCDWAWDGATGPLLEAIPARSRGSRRVVLVPAGELGLVAWHAARQRITGGGYRYASQEAVFTYTSSARQFVSTAGRQPRPWAERPVLISDAESSLEATAHGICHLHESYYPKASVFGYARIVSSQLSEDPKSEAATGEDVLAALAHGADPGASVLHFGCHGSAEVPVLDSRLNLGEGHAVAVERILAQARTRSGQAPGGLVVLASCLTDVAEADYDEAVTLATAFLSAGAAGVVAARWTVPEGATALFMAAFHHYLTECGQHPAEALHSAQTWMLDPGRGPLRPLPPILRDETAKPDLADPVAWAGFAYQGW
jgi:CHAT domain